MLVPIFLLQSLHSIAGPSIIPKVNSFVCTWSEANTVQPSQLRSCWQQAHVIVCPKIPCMPAGLAVRGKEQAAAARCKPNLGSSPLPSFASLRVEMLTVALMLLTGRRICLDCSDLSSLTVRTHHGILHNRQGTTRNSKCKASTTGG